MSFPGYAMPIELPRSAVRSTSRSSNNEGSVPRPSLEIRPPQASLDDAQSRSNSRPNSANHSRSSSSAFNLGTSKPSVGIDYGRVASPRPSAPSRTSSGLHTLRENEPQDNTDMQKTPEMTHASTFDVTFSPETSLLPAIEDKPRTTSFSTIASTSASEHGRSEGVSRMTALGISAPPSARASSTSLAPSNSSRPGPAPHPSVKPLSSKDIRLLQAGLQISPGGASPGGYELMGSPMDHRADPFATPSKTANQTAHASGTATPLTTEHNRAKYEAYRVLIETDTASFVSSVGGETEGEDGKKAEEIVEDESTDVGKLRKALKAVLHDAEDLSRQNLALRTLQSDLETKLKITMSNLQLAEMNSELLEEALKRGGEGFAGRMGPVVHHGQYASSSTTEAARNAANNAEAESRSVAKREAAKSSAPVRHSMDSIGFNPAITTAFGYGGMRGSLAGAIASGNPTPINSRPNSRAPSRQGSETGRERESAGMGPGVKVQPPSRPMSAIPAGFDPSAIRPGMIRRRSSDGTGTKTSDSASDSAPRSVSGQGPPKPSQLTRSNTLKATAMPTPRRPTNARPPMERSATTGPGSIPGDLSFSESLGSVGSSLGGFFRKNLEKNGAAAGIMRELGLNQLKMPDLNSLPLAMPTPSSMTPRSEFLANSPPKSTAAPPRPLSNMLESPSGPSQAEVQKLRATLTQSQLTLRALTSELDTLKKAKSDLEGELESLSQALFEEANKMVSEERKKHSKVIEEVKRELAEVREELDEVRKEREAVKRTMVLLEGGSARASMDVTAESAKTDTKTNANSDDGEKKDALPIVAPQPRVASAEEVEQLMKRMEEDFGKL